MSDQPAPGTCGCGADFRGLLAHMAENLEAHADRDGLTGVMRAVFLARGGHAPGTACPTAEPIEFHDSGCAWFMGDECDFGCAVIHAP